MRDDSGDTWTVVVQVGPLPGGDQEELAEATTMLRSELLDGLDVVAVEGIAGQGAPEGAKGLADLVGCLAVQFGTVEGLRALLHALHDWVVRTNRAVEITYGDDVLKLSHVSVGQQEKMIDDWLAHHAAGA